VISLEPLKEIEGFIVRLPRVPLTVRSLLTTIAIAACAVALAKFWMRRAQFLGIAEAHESRAYDYGENRRAMCWIDEAFEDGDHTRMKPEFSRHLDTLRDHFDRQARKYRRAASQPWLAVESDPPVPECDLY
jgi:hypothetical protein